jgi:hypothetical protein
MEKHWRQANAATRWKFEPTSFTVQEGCPEQGYINCKNVGFQALAVVGFVSPALLPDHSNRPLRNRTCRAVWAGTGRRRAPIAIMRATPLTMP